MGLACIAAALRQDGNQVKAFDWNVEMFHKLDRALWDLDNDFDWRDPQRFAESVLPRIQPMLDGLLDAVLADSYDAIGFTVFGSSLMTVSYASKYLRARSSTIKILWGGPNVLWPDITEPFAFIDAAMVGEGEAAAVATVKAWTEKRSLEAIPGLIWNDRETGNVVHNPRAPGLAINQIPIPDYSDFDFGRYLERIVPIQLSRGCVANCSFCEEKKWLWPGFQMKEPRRIVDEIRALKEATGLSVFCSADSLMNGDHRKLEKVADLLIEENLGVAWGGNMRIDVKLTPALLKKLKAAGCHWVTFGVESGSDEVLKYMRKGIRGHHIATTLKNVHEAGIKIGVNIIVGFPGEYEAQYQETVSMLDECREIIANISTAQFSIGPRSPIACNLKAYDILLDENDQVVWDDKPNDAAGWYSKDKTLTREVRTERLFQLRNHIEANLTGITHNRVADGDVP
jgi:anaerobic magnesium-protoporphyrin IX monomethyl ester cyclase